MHPPQMLRKQILAIEVVVHRMVYPWRRRTHVASPKSQLDMFRADMSLPLILARKRASAIVLRKYARKRSRVVRLRAHICRARHRQLIRRLGIRTALAIELFGFEVLQFDRSSRLRFLNHRRRARYDFAGFRTIILRRLLLRLGLSTALPKPCQQALFTPLFACPDRNKTATRAHQTKKETQFTRTRAFLCLQENCYKSTCKKVVFCGDSLG
jgi:hypothetical protein